MHIVGLLLSALGVAAFWYYRYRQSRVLIDHTVDAVGRARGAYNRSRFKKKARASVLTGIDDPVLAMTVLLVSLVEARAPMTGTQEPQIKNILQKFTGVHCSDEHVAFARWACRETPDANQVIRGLLPLWEEKLNAPARRDVLDMAHSIVGDTDTADFAQQDALRRLKAGLHLS